MTESSEQVSLREAIEQQLRDLAANKPGFIERVVLDPKGTIEPMIRAVLDDDGEVDLSDYDINVVVARPKSLTFVLDVDESEDEELAEVSGFTAMRGFGEINFRAIQVFKPPRIGAATTGACSGSDATCHTDSGETNYCGGCR